jgi:hypothetical protein
VSGLRSGAGVPQKGCGALWCTTTWPVTARTGPTRRRLTHEIGDRAHRRTRTIARRWVQVPPVPPQKTPAHAEVFFFQGSVSGAFEERAPAAATTLGCSDARMLGCSDARMLGCSDARMLGCSDARMLGCSDARMLAATLPAHQRQGVVALSGALLEGQRHRRSAVRLTFSRKASRRPERSRPDTSRDGRRRR